MSTFFEVGFLEDTDATLQAVGEGYHPVSHNASHK